MSRKTRRRKPSKESVPKLLEKAGREFELDQRKILGATDSAHQAVAGKLEDKDVVVKPFRSGHAGQKANNELLRTRQLRNKGLITPLPLEVIDLKRMKVALYISQYMPGVIGAHTLSYEADPDSEEGKALKNPVSSIARTLGELHGRRFTHGDPQVKNFGFRSEDVFTDPFIKPVVFDLEGSSKYSARGMGDEMFKANSQKDIDKLAVSLGARQYGGSDVKVAEDIMRETVVNEYMNTIAHENLGRLAMASVIDRAQGKFLLGREGKLPSIPNASEQLRVA